MGQLGAYRGLSRLFGSLARFVGVCAAGLALANCSGGNMAGRVDPRYGVAASAAWLNRAAGAERRRRLPGRQALVVAGRTYVPEENHQLQRRSASPRGTATISMAATPPMAKSST